MMESRLNALGQHVSKLTQMFDGTSCIFSILHVTKLCVGSLSRGH